MMSLFLSRRILRVYSQKFFIHKQTMFITKPSKRMVI